jgi:glycosyltransferase involved in cell wall biosynthesis
MMKSDSFFISVIIPVFNGEAFLKQAVESVLCQNYGSMEIIVVDDGSTDQTRNIAAHFGNSIRYVFQANRGPASARNTGLAAASGNIIGFLDADDLWKENRLEVQLRYLKEKSSYDIVLGFTQCIVQGKEGAESFKEPWCCVQLGAALIRKQVFTAVGLFDETYHLCEDWDWFMRAEEAGFSVLKHPEVVQFYRRHGENITNRKKMVTGYQLKAIKSALDRRRKK